MYPQPTNNQAPTTDYGQAYNSFANVYEPQVQAIRDAEAQAYSTRDATINQLTQDKTTNLSRLDQAKSNAFSNNSLTSNARGLFYSGYAPAQNNAYVTNTYNPNVDRVNTAFKRGSDAASIRAGDTVKSLEQKIAEINQQRANDANSLVMNTKDAQAKAALSAYKSGLPTSSQNQQAFSNASLQNLVNQTGKDGHISPEAYANEAIKWLNAGYSISQFNSLVNANNLRNKEKDYYNYALTQALKRGK